MTTVLVSTCFAMFSFSSFSCLVLQNIVLCLDRQDAFLGLDLRDIVLGFDGHGTRTKTRTVVLVLSGDDWSLERHGSSLSSRSTNTGGWYSLAGIGARHQLLIGCKRLKWQAAL